MVVGWYSGAGYTMEKGDVEEDVDDEKGMDVVLEKDGDDRHVVLEKSGGDRHVVLGKVGNVDEIWEVDENDDGVVKLVVEEGKGGMGEELVVDEYDVDEV